MRSLGRSSGFRFGVLVSFLAARAALATVGDTAVVEGTVLSFDRDTVTLDSRGVHQKIPRSLVPEGVKLKNGLFLTIEIPVSAASPQPKK